MLKLIKNDSVIVNNVKFTVLKRDGKRLLMHWIDANGNECTQWVIDNNNKRKVA
jgi:hypothetical protein